MSGAPNPFWGAALLVQAPSAFRFGAKFSPCGWFLANYARERIINRCQNVEGTVS
jgi:hypothetical protein